MSKWDKEDLNQQQPQVEDDHQNSNDGFQDSNHQDDEMQEEAIDEVQVKKKSGPNPKIILGAMVVVTLGVVGYMGTTMYGKFAKPKPVEISQVEIQSPVIQPDPTAVPQDSKPLDATAAVPVEPVTPLMPAEAALVAATPAVAPVAAPDSVVQTNQVPVSINSVTSTLAQIPAPAVAPAPVDSVAMADLTKKMSSQDDRLKGIEAGMKDLQQSISALSKRPTASQSTQATPVASTPASQTRRVRKPAKPVVAAAASESVEQSQLPDGLSLRGVYPPQGENRQAWIMDAKSGSISVVTQGSVFNEATVIRVESDRVVTNRGVIR